MEVHHHTHTDPTHGGTSRKKFTHYLWEFLMLFLAIFCGFLAENYREHLVEHQREKQYMRSLTEDLARDIRQIEINQRLLKRFISRLDSIETDFNDLKGGMPSLATMKQVHRGIGFPDFIYTDRTIQQLKNAGNMRLVRNLPVADSITEYDATVRRGLVHQDLVNQLFAQKFDDKIKSIINIKLMNQLIMGNPNEDETNFILKHILLTHDKTELIRFTNEVDDYKTMIDVLFLFISQDKEMAERLLIFIKKEYHIQ